MDENKAMTITTIGVGLSAVGLVAVLGYFVERCEANEQRTVAECLRHHPPLECKLIELKVRE